jgi:nucleotide-binding universal stress UspA family protein
MLRMLQLATPPPSSAAGNALFPRVLLAIDFGPASLGAARWATTHVTRSPDAVLTHVMPFADGSRLGDTTTAEKHESLRRMTPALVGGLGGFAATLDVAEHRSIVRVGSPSGSLAAIAADAGTTLMVLGRRTDANRIGVGEPNVIERTARRTKSSVLIVPEGTTTPPDHIIAAVDESLFAPHALRVASWLARMHEIPLTVLHVLPPATGTYERALRSPRHVASQSRGGKERTRERTAIPGSLAPSMMRWFVQLGRAHRVMGRDTTRVALGDPAREIMRAAVERGPSLVVVGMRGADEAPDGSIGSVARELLTRGPMPVLAVNPS